MSYGWGESWDSEETEAPLAISQEILREDTGESVS